MRRGGPARHAASAPTGKRACSTSLSDRRVLTRGQVALRTNPLDAIQVAEEALNDDPSNMAAHELLADAAMAAGLPKTAILSLEVAFKSRPADRKLAMKLAEAAGELGQRNRGTHLSGPSSSRSPGRRGQ